MWLIRKLGSLTFAAIISVSLMVLLIFSTTMESIHGTSFAQKMFYQTRWFDLVLSLLWINIFCSTILRFPFKKYHIGFIVTHIGILGLLLGALLARMFSVEGQMILAEGETSHQIQLDGYQLNIQTPSKQIALVNLRKSSYVIPAGNTNLNISIGKILEHASENLVVKKGNASDPKKYALHLTLQSPTMNLNHSFWVIGDDLKKFQSNAVFIGPMKISLQEKNVSSAVQWPTLIISNKTGKELIKIDLSKPINEKILLNYENLKIIGLQYYPYARVTGNKLTNTPDSGSLNPAVEFDVVDSKGKTQHYIKFALFPDFDSMHHKAVTQDFDVVSRLDIPQGNRDDAYSGPSLTFFVTPEGKWSYRADSKDNTVKEGEVGPNVAVPLGWADMTFRAEELLDNAVTSYVFVESPNKQGGIAVETTIQSKDENYRQWLMENQTEKIRTSAGDIVLSLDSMKKNLPFFLSLKDFKRKDYPGTETPSSFESDVTLEDTKENIKIEKTISMNKPLDYKGFRIFQSSYIQNPNAGEFSIFTVAKNPGIFLIYFSSCTLFTGAILQFYVKQFSRKPDANGKKEA